MRDSTTPQARLQTLGALARADLAAIAEAFELRVDKRSKPKLLAAIAGAALPLGEVLAPLPAGPLGAMARALGLAAPAEGEAGLRAQVLAALGGDAAAGGVAGRAEADGAAGGRLLDEKVLGGLLWSAADILRGSVDSSDYKAYIFGLLFLKRLSDEFEEEAERLVAGGVDRQDAWEDPDEHTFFVPKAARWPTLAARTEQLGEALNQACDAIEDANPSLKDVLATDFNDAQRLGDAKARDGVLGRLITHFSKINLKNRALMDPDVLGRAYEYLIERFADDAGKKGGEFYTPKEVVQLIVALLEPAPGMRICDPTCGSGGMLIQSARYVLKKHPKKKLNLTLHGQEKNLGTWGICRMNMVLHHLPDHKIEKGDTIRDPKLIKERELDLYDRVIANPPFSLKDWGHELAAKDPYGRFHYGLPPKTKGDFAFVQHMLATLKQSGRLAVVMPHGVLFRGSSEGKIRAKLLEEDLFEAVIGLPPQLFNGTGIPAAILVLRRDKPADRKHKLLFIDASQEFQAGAARNLLRPADIDKICATFAGFKDVDRYARVVGLDEVEKNDHNLNISRYVDTAEEAERIDVGEAVAKLRALEAARAEAEATMNGFLRELGYDS